MGESKRLLSKQRDWLVIKIQEEMVNKSKYSWSGIHLEQVLLIEQLVS